MDPEDHLSTPRHDAVRAALERIALEAGAWEGVTLAPQRGGTAFHLGRLEFGRTHDVGLLDVLLPPPVRDRVVEEGEARPHHAFPGSGWVTLRVSGADDVERALELLRLAHGLGPE